jgi:DNA polymerase, archaea type
VRPRRGPSKASNMNKDIPSRHDPLLFGRSDEGGLVALEHGERRDGDCMTLFVRSGAETRRETEAFQPFLIAAADQLGDFDQACERTDLAGNGPLNTLLRFRTWKDCVKARDWLSKKTGRTPASPDAPYLWISDPVHQHLLATGRTLFKDMAFDDVRRLQVDIECLTSAGYEFCNAEREGDRIVAIGVGDQTGWTEIIGGPGMEEKQILARFVEAVRERDPDVLEGHNIFNFDLPYLFARARMLGVDMALGRDGSVPVSRPSRFSVGERTVSYERFDVYGRHVVDTMFLVHAYDISHRSLGGFGLKEVAVHFGLASPDRTYIEGSEISREYARDPAKVLRYLKDDVQETRGVSSLLSRSFFVQAQMLPYSYQNVCVRGTATRIDALMLREYLRQGHALAMPDSARPFAGGYTDMFVQGIVRNVHHCDVRSLYPSLMLAGGIAPGRDDLGVFLKLLERLREVRLRAKERMKQARTPAERNDLDAMQTTFKVLINSFYGYLGFSQARFGDFDAAEEVTRRGRELLGRMIEWLRENDATPVEIDTDGIYFVPPANETAKGREDFRRRFAESLPKGIEIEFDGEYVSMYSYKMKNYALLDADGEIVIKGAALKSRGLEPFQRNFLREAIRFKLEGREKEIGALKSQYEKAMRSRAWPVAQFAKTERLQDSPQTYQSKRIRGKCPKDAAYELALKSEQPYRAGDQISYYVTGEKKNVSVHEMARLVSDWNPSRRDENVEYYLAKLEALMEKFGNPEPVRAQMDLGI